MSAAEPGIVAEWFGCATFRIRVAGLTLFFDTYLDKVPGLPPCGLRAGEVAQADFLFISHAHFDHVHGADVIASATGATIVGNHETAWLMRTNGVPHTQIVATAGGDTVHCGPDVTVRALPAQHSCLYAAAAADSSHVCLGDLGISAQERRTREQSLLELLATVSDEHAAWFADAQAHTSDRDGGQLAYLLDSPEGSVLINASSGYWHGIFAGLRPDVAILAAAGRPNVDGEPYQGSLCELLTEQVALLGDPTTILCHHDALLPPLINATDVTAAEKALRDRLGPRYLTLEQGRPHRLTPT